MIAGTRKRGADDERERRGVAKHRPASDRRQLRQPIGDRQHDQRHDQRARPELRAHLERVVPAHRRGRRHAARLERRHRGGDERQRQTDRDRRPHVARCSSPAAPLPPRCTTCVTVDEVSVTAASASSARQPEAEHDAGGGQRSGFAEEQQQHLAPRQPERAQRADLLPPRHHRDRDRCCRRGTVRRSARSTTAPSGWRETRRAWFRPARLRRDGRCAERPGGSRAAMASSAASRSAPSGSSTSTRSTRPRRSNASCAAAMSIRMKLPSSTRAGPSSFR